MTEMKELTSMEEVGQILEESENKPIFIFKHSSICSISDRALRQYESFIQSYKAEVNDGDFLFYLIRIRDHRALSNEIAARTGVKHESPQAILIVKGKAVWTDSHFEISEDKFKQVVMMYENGNFKD